MLSTWTTLALGSDDSGIIVRYNFQADSCTVQLSDLDTVFSESLSKDEIIERAEDEDSCIDPSSGQDQMDMLLSKLKSALEGQSGTEVQLKSPSDRRRNLRLSVDLPDPLPQLRWSFRLKPDATASVGKDVLRPILATAFARQTMISQLVELIGEKDMAITKMLDKLETSGIDLSAIFPAAVQGRSKKQNVKRSQVVQHTKGLAPFNRQAWESSLQLAEEGQVTFGQLISGAFDSRARPAVQQALDTTQNASKSKPTPRLMKHESTAGGSDDFQRQELPHHLQPQPLSLQENIPDNVSTASEASATEPSPPPVRSTTSRPRLGQLGNARRQQRPDQPIKARSQTPSLPPSSPPRPSTAHDPPTSPPEQPQSPPSRPSTSEAPPPASEKPPSTRSRPAKLGKLGGIKGRSGTAPPSSPPAARHDAPRKAEEDADDDIGPSQILPPSSPALSQSSSLAAAKPAHVKDGAQEETAEQKAERRREELKRRLQTKGAGAAGTGKRRRF